MLLFGHIGLTLGIFFIISLLTRRKFSYSLIIICSILPDLIDKPLGRVILPLGSGRLIGHTLALLLILIFIGIYWRILFIALASALHLIQDRMWEQPAILLWPMLGRFQFHEAISVSDYVSGLARGFSPSLSLTFISEMAGLAILMAFFAFEVQKHLRRDQRN
jgi:hypothetical protein